MLELLVKQLGMVGCGVDVHPLAMSDLEAILPHRFKAMLIDEAVFLPESNEVIAIKSLRCRLQGDVIFTTTIAESNIAEMFHGHFPSNRVLPGYFLDEMGNLAVAVLYACMNKTTGIPAVMSKKGVTYHAMVQPNDTLIIKAFNPVTPKRKRFACSVEIRNQDGKMVCEIEEIYGVDISALAGRTKT